MCIIEVLSPYCLGILGISSIAALSWYNRDLVDRALSLHSHYYLPFFLSSSLGLCVLTMLSLISHNIQKCRSLLSIVRCCPIVRVIPSDNVPRIVVAHLSPLMWRAWQSRVVRFASIKMRAFRRSHILHHDAPLCRHPSPGRSQRFHRSLSTHRRLTINWSTGQLLTRTTDSWSIRLRTNGFALTQSTRLLTSVLLGQLIDSFERLVGRPTFEINDTTESTLDVDVCYQRFRRPTATISGTIVWTLSSNARTTDHIDDFFVSCNDYIVVIIYRCIVVRL